MKQNRGVNVKVIGLIGGCGTGKSEVSRLLKKQFDAYILDADKIGHEIILKGTDAYNQIVDFFGQAILDNNQEIDRKLLGDIVFSNGEQLKILNHITHPIIYKEIKELIFDLKNNNQIPFIVLEAAIMVESGFTDLVDEVWLITCPLEKRIERLIKYRHMSREKIDKILLMQKPEEELKRYTDIIIDNGKDIINTTTQLKKNVDKILEDTHENK